MSTKTVRGRILDDAKHLTEGDRQAVYGDPKINLQKFADLLSVYFGVNVRSVDAAVIMALAKLSRIATGAPHRDNFVDLAAYAAIAGECVADEQLGLAIKKKGGEAAQPPELCQLSFDLR